ncbi:hypothetical protein CR155_20275 [Pollutimonas nitritireducens]|uniref:Uncharacterized protein n=1 Tax=Pollutimonas nitritireducens TaxID=2045209 RepID=A0A2N4UAI5_9BURK|nr:hypothetical protein [Pollutimonas nitritireducens]PLC52036.1 hypothetical protein CR155_20275 [Pollutimonas nitritireducens]
MPLPSQYLVINLSPEQQHTLRERAEFFGLKESELILWALDAMTARSAEREVLNLLDEIEASSKAACRAVDDALSFVAESNQRIARMEARSNVVH